MTAAKSVGKELVRCGCPYCGRTVVIREAADGTGVVSHGKPACQTYELTESRDFVSMLTQLHLFGGGRASLGGSS